MLGLCPKQYGRNCNVFNFSTISGGLQKWGVIFIFQTKIVDPVPRASKCTPKKMRRIRVVKIAVVKIETAMLNKP